MIDLKLKNKVLDEFLTNTILSVDKIDLLYKKGEKKPFLYRNLKPVLIIEGVLIFLLSILVCNFLFSSTEWYYSIILIVTSLVFSVVSFTVTFYFTSRPIIKQMKKNNYDISNLKIRALVSEELNQRWLTKIYKECIKMGFLTGKLKEDLFRISEYTTGILKIHTYHQSVTQFGIKPAHIVAGGLLIIGALITSFLPSEYLSKSEMWQVKEKMIICSLVFLVLYLAYLFGGVLIKTYDSFVNKGFNRTKKACRILDELSINLIYGLIETEEKEGKTKINKM